MPRPFAFVALTFAVACGDPTPPAASPTTVATGPASASTASSFAASTPSSIAAPPSANVELGDAGASLVVRRDPPTVMGRLPREIVDRVVLHDNQNVFRACYEVGLRDNPSLEGNVSLRFVVDKNGAVASISNVASNMGDDVTRCVIDGVRSLSFPRPDGGTVIVVYPFRFTRS